MSERNLHRNPKPAAADHKADHKKTWVSWVTPASANFHLAPPRFFTYKLDGDFFKEPPLIIALLQGTAWKLFRHACLFSGFFVFYHKGIPKLFKEPRTH